jgi:hypothetical protein
MVIGRAWGQDLQGRGDETRKKQIPEDSTTARNQRDLLSVRPIKCCGAYPLKYHFKTVASRLLKKKKKRKGVE